MHNKTAFIYFQYLTCILMLLWSYTTVSKLSALETFNLNAAGEKNGNTGQQRLKHECSQQTLMAIAWLLNNPQDFSGR